MKYQLLPKPKILKENEGLFITNGCSVLLKGDFEYRIIKAAVSLRKVLTFADNSVHKFLRADSGTENSVSIVLNGKLKSEEYTLSIQKNCIEISGGDAAGCFYGIHTLKQIVEAYGNNLPCIEISDYPDMRYRGFYHDATRGRVPSVLGVKKLVDQLAALKVNSLQLYVEHTFDFAEFKNDNRDEDQYLSVEDILAIDQYCYDNFIDFVPSLSTFGHLYQLLMKEEYKGLCELENFESETHFWKERMMHHTIDPTNSKSFELVCSLIDQYLPLFRSKYFNICCDETFDLGKGRNVGKDIGKIYCDFVEKIINHVTSMGKTVMMWGDIALQHSQALNRIPKDTIFLNWDYSSEPDKKNIMRIMGQGFNQITCPGTTSWARLIELPSVSIPNITKYANYCKDFDGMGILNTNWGDYGHPCSPECSLYGTTLGACVGWNVNTEVNEEFDKAVSYFIYGSETNIIPWISRVADIHFKSATWDAFFCLIEESNDNFFKDYTDAALLSKECFEIAEQLKSVPDKKDIIKYVINAVEGVALLNEAADVINKRKNREELKIKFEKWLECYEEMWISSAKPSELFVVKEFIRKIYLILN